MIKVKSMAFPRSLCVLCAGVFLNRFGSFVSVFLVLYMIARGYTPIQAGIAPGAYGIGSFLAGSTLLAFIYFQHLSTFALQVQADGLSSTMYGLLISVNGICVILLELPLSGITRRLPTLPVITFGWLLIAVGFALIAISHTLVLLILSETVSGARWKVASITERLRRFRSERIAQQEMARTAFDADERSPDRVFWRELDAADEAGSLDGFVPSGDLRGER